MIGTWSDFRAMAREVGPVSVDGHAGSLSARCRDARCIVDLSRFGLAPAAVIATLRAPGMREGSVEVVVSSSASLAGLSRMYIVSGWAVRQRNRRHAALLEDMVHDGSSRHNHRHIDAWGSGRPRSSQAARRAHVRSVGWRTMMCSGCGAV